MDELTSTSPLRILESGNYGSDEAPCMLREAVCSNRAATRVNLLKPREKRYEGNASFCSNFAISRTSEKTIALPSHGRGRWFETSIAHFGKWVETVDLFAGIVVGAGYAPHGISTHGHKMLNRLPCFSPRG